MWYCLVKSKTGKSFTTFNVGSEAEAIQTGQKACIYSGGQQYFTIEIPDNTHKQDIKGAINRQMWEKYHIQLEDISKRHFKGKML